MHKNLRIALILLIGIFLSSNFLASWVLPAQAAAQEDTVVEPSSINIITIDSNPVAQAVIGLFYLLFGALTFIPLLGANPRSGVIRYDHDHSIDQN